MNRTFKIRILVLSMITFVVVASVSAIYATKWDNGDTTEDSADIVFSLMADKTELSVGDTLTLEYNVATAPKNGNGLGALGTRIVYDSSKLELQRYHDDEYEDDFDDIQPGPIGKRLGLTPGSANVSTVSGSQKQIVISAAQQGSNGIKNTGNIVTIKFKVKEGASGPLDVFVQKEESGFVASGYAPNEKDNLVTQPLTPYLKTNLDDLKVKVPATGVSFKKSGVTLETSGSNTSVNLNTDEYLTLDPSNTTDEVSWESDNNSVATVDANGLVRAQGKGTAHITVRVGGYSATINVTVSVPLENVTFDIDKVTLDVTNDPTKDVSGNVRLHPDGAEADKSSYQWSTDTDSVVTVQNGVLHAEGKGNANVTVTVNGHSASLPVEVIKTIGNVSFSKSEIALNNEDKTSDNLNNYLIKNPEDADIESITWESSNPGVATVNRETGVVEQKGRGETIITVNVDGKTATIKVVVTLAVKDFSFRDSELALDVTNKPTANLKDNIVFSPEGSSSSDLEWEIVEPDNGVVSIDDDGNVTALKKGKATIKLTVDGKYEKTMTINVTAAVGSVRFVKDRVTLDVTEEPTVNLDTPDYLEINPTDADYTSKTWTSSNTDVATVENGVVTAHKKGETTITVNVDGKTATMTVVVAVKLKSITLEKDEVTVYKNDTENVVVTANPDGAVWDTLDASIKTGDSYAMAKVVDDHVEITGVAEGTTVVTVAANGGQVEGFTKEITVTVKENPITSLKVTAEDDDDLLRGKTKQLTSSYTTREPETVHVTTDDPTVKWTSEDESIATVDQNGVVKGVKEGTVVIKATLANGLEATYKVTVKEVHIDGVVIEDDTIKSLQDLGSVEVGDTIEIPFKVSPENCTDTADEIKEFLQAEFDENLVDVEITYDEETHSGKITVHAKQAGRAEVEFTEGKATEDEDAKKFAIAFDIVEPAAEADGQSPETGDMPVVLVATIMAISLAGIVVSKKVLVK